MGQLLVGSGIEREGWLCFCLGKRVFIAISPKETWAGTKKKTVF